MKNIPNSELIYAQSQLLFANNYVNKLYLKNKKPTFTDLQKIKEWEEELIRLEVEIEIMNYTPASLMQTSI